MNLCVAIFQERTRANITHQMLSSKFGLPVQQFRCYESGVIIPPIELLIKMSDYFSCPPSTKCHLLSLRSKFQIKYPEDMVPQVSIRECA